MSHRKVKRRIQWTRLVLLGLLVSALTFSILVLFNRQPQDPEPEDTAEPTAEASQTPEPSKDPEPVQNELLTLAPADAPMPAGDNAAGFTTDWYINQDDGNAWLSAQFNRAEISIVQPQSSLAYGREGMPWLNGHTYHIYFTASAAKETPVRIAAYTGSTEFSTEEITVGESRYYDIPLTNNGSTSWNGGLFFYLGSSPADNTVVISDLRIAAEVPAVSAKTDQIGYLPNARKRCTFPARSGDVFDVVRAETHEVVYSGALINYEYSELNGETVCVGDFTSLTDSGTYYVRSQTGTVSAPFVIDRNVYKDLGSALLNMLSLQRCGMDLDTSWAGDLAHGACHTAEARIWLTENAVDVHGGWHDAGDYGRYTKTGAKAAADLLMAYLINPAVFEDNQGPDAFNGVPDVLDEARYELEWLLRMQDNSGGVYNTVMTPQFAGIVDPTEDNQPLILLFIETSATGSVGGTFALASIVYREIDPEFSAVCLEAARKADLFLDNHREQMEYKNPDELNGGLYRDASDTDARFYSKMMLYLATGEEEYFNKASDYRYYVPEAQEGLNWNELGGYARYLYLAMVPGSTFNDVIYDDLKESLINEANVAIGMNRADGYGSSLEQYEWGSNGLLSDNGLLLSMAYDITGNPEYRAAAYEQLNYLFGRNSLGLCFVTGFGSASPQYPHSRVGLAHKAYLTGALVGGPDSFREDKVTQGLSYDLPPAKVYIDSPDAYSVNEIAIYWNSSLIHLLAALER